jgi:hypothetical protein
MHRWLMIFLMVLLPLQLGWAALGSFCQHETGDQAQHFGHHFHQHQADTDADDAHPEGGKTQHSDCNSCISGSITPSLRSALLVSLIPAEALVSGLETHPLFRPTSPPERPAKPRLA